MEQKGVEIINNLVSLWTNRFMFLTKFVEKKEQVYKFQCEFSDPLPSLPISQWTIMVFFQIVDCDPPQIYFRFENDQLTHTPDSTIILNKMEQWIQQYLDKKRRTSQVMFLGTQFEFTRIKHEKIGKMKQENSYKEVFTVEHFLDKSLLETDDELENIFYEGDENHLIQELRTFLFAIFRAVDKEDLGVISFAEATQILKNVNLSIKPHEIEDLRYQLDVHKNGLVDYRNFADLGSQIVFGYFLKNQVENKIKNKDEEFLTEAIMILYNHEIHDIARSWVLKLEEEDSEPFITLKFVKSLLLEIKDENILNNEEIQGIMKKIQKKYNDSFPYIDLPNVLIQYKITNIKNGLMESSFSKIDHYLISIFKTYEKQKKEYIHIDELIMALKSSSKMKLSNFELVLINSFIETDDENMVLFKQAARQVGELIKRFFSSVMNDLKKRFDDQRLVSKDEKVEGWTTDDIQKEVEQLFINCGLERKNQFDLENFKKLLKTFENEIDENEVEKNFTKADSNKNGSVCRTEFKNFINEQLMNKKIQSQICSLNSL